LVTCELHATSFFCSASPRWSTAPPTRARTDRRLDAGEHQSPVCQRNPRRPRVEDRGILRPAERRPIRVGERRLEMKPSRRVDLHLGAHDEIPSTIASR
jgi:hypothetical protein